jgi:hypothetical protein
MLTGVSNIFTPSGQKSAENQNQQTQPNTEEQGQPQTTSQSNSGSSQSSNTSGAAQAQTAVSSSKAENASKSGQTASASQGASNENAEASSSFNDSAYTRRVAERVQAEMIMNSVFTSKTQSSVLPSLFASESQETGTTNKAVLSEYMKNSEPA